MKISFIICYSSTWPMTVFDKEAHPEADKELDKKILKQRTNGRHFFYFDMYFFF